MEIYKVMAKVSASDEKFTTLFYQSLNQEKIDELFASYSFIMISKMSLL